MYRPIDELGRLIRRLEFEQVFSETSSEASSNSSSTFSSPTSSLAANFRNPMTQQEDNQQRTLKDCLHLKRTITSSCIMFSPNTPNQEFKPGMIQLLPTFHGLESENPYVHIREFEEVVATFHSWAEAANFVRLKFFPFSLKDKAKSWLYSL